MSIIVILKPCGCGAPAELREHPDAIPHNRWSVRCGRIATGMRNKNGRPRTACHDSEAVYASRKELAVGRWNRQFEPLTADADDGTPRCRCGLRVAKFGDSCNDCLKPVEWYARSGCSTSDIEQARLR